MDLIVQREASLTRVKRKSFIAIQTFGKSDIPYEYGLEAHYFSDHMQKHEKPYRCDLPNCPNTTGFARLDQLERHKQKVKHSQSGWKVQQYS